MNRYIFNTILVHVSRTWERMRLKQEFEEMPLDNIESVDAILNVTKIVFSDKIIQEFIDIDVDDDWDWNEKTGYGCSDVYIEALAEKIIIAEYLD